MTTETIAWTFLTLSLLLGLLTLWALLRRFQPQPPVMEEKTDQTFSIGPPEKRDGRAHVYITIGGQKFYFSYAPADEKEVIRCTGNIKRSLQLMEESRYEDIIGSRYQETVGSLAKLGKLTDMGEEEIQTARQIFGAYRDKLVGEL